MANLYRVVAEELMRAYVAEHGPSGSEPKMENVPTSKTIQDELARRNTELEHDTIATILDDLAKQDYIAIVRSTEGDGRERQVVKIFPVRLKRDFNLWHVLEEF